MVAGKEVFEVRNKGEQMSVNVVVLSGRLGKDPELRATTTGKSVVQFSIAVDDGWGKRCSELLGVKGA